MKATFILLLTLLSYTAQTQSMDHQVPAPELPWRIVNDGVMGGLSQSQMEKTEEGHAYFSGKVSLDNNGGFASTRAYLPEAMREGTRQVSIRVKGDGHRYSLRLRPEGRYGRVSYRAYFETKAGEWQEFTFALSDFTPTFRGRVLTDVPSVEGQALEEIGLLIADKQEGSFELVVDWVRMEE